MMNFWNLVPPARSPIIKRGLLTVNACFGPIYFRESQVFNDENTVQVNTPNYNKLDEEMQCQVTYSIYLHFTRYLAFFIH
jgi:hypothetical protein